MSRKSVYDFFDGSPGYDEDPRKHSMSEGKGDRSTHGKSMIDDASKHSSENTDMEETSIVAQENVPDLSGSNLLTDYVIVEMVDENYIPRIKSGAPARVKTPYPKQSKINSNAKHFAQTNSPRDDERNADNFARETHGSYKDEGDVDEIKEVGSYWNSVRIEHVIIPQVDSSRSEISYYEEEEEDGEEDDSSTGSVAEDDSDAPETDEGEEYDSDDDNLDGVDDPPYEGQVSVTRASNSRLSALNSNLYKTDGEDFSDIAITRSFACLHRQEIVEAGAKTIGELYASLKRKKAQEIADNTEENRENRDMSSSQLILKRKDENEKLKNKAKQIYPKSTIPFEEKPISKTRQTESASDDSKPVVIPKKVFAGKARGSPKSSVTLKSVIHVEPEVRGDMGSTTAPATVTPSDELTRLCSTGTDNRSSGRNNSIDSQLISDVDSRTGYISGRKNPQTRITAVIREAGRSRIPLPIIRGTGARPDRDSATPENTERSKIWLEHMATVSSACII